MTNISSRITKIAWKHLKSLVCRPALDDKYVMTKKKLEEISKFVMPPSVGWQLSHDNVLGKISKLMMPHSVGWQTSHDINFLDKLRAFGVKMQSPYGTNCCTLVYWCGNKALVVAVTTKYSNLVPV